MVLIVGWGGGVTQDLGEVAPTVCPRCHNAVFLHEIRSDKKFSVYFVPIYQYENNAYLACPICHTGVQLGPGQIGAADRMRVTTKQFRQRRLDEPTYRAAVERFWATLGVAPSGNQVLHAAPTIPPPAAPGTTVAMPASAAAAGVADQIADLAKLHADGILSDEEFATAKRRVLER